MRYTDCGGIADSYSTASEDQLVLQREACCQCAKEATDIADTLGFLTALWVQGEFHTAEPRASTAPLYYSKPGPS